MQLGPRFGFVDYGMSGYNLGNEASTNMPVYMPTQFSSVDAAARYDAAGNRISQTFGRLNGARAPRRMQATIRLSF